MGKGEDRCRRRWEVWRSGERGREVERRERWTKVEGGGGGGKGGGRGGGP